MSFSDFPFIPEAIPDRSKDARWYPHHTEVQAWLERFAETFGLLDAIHFRRRVVWAEPVWEGEAWASCACLEVQSFQQGASKENSRVQDEAWDVCEDPKADNSML